MVKATEASGTTYRIESPTFPDSNCDACVEIEVAAHTTEDQLISLMAALNRIYQTFLGNPLVFAPLDEAESQPIRFKSELRESDDHEEQNTDRDRQA